MSHAKDFRCNNCDEPDFYCSTSAKLVEHYHQKHPEDFLGCWDAVGATWDPNLNFLLGQLGDLKKQLARCEEELRTARGLNQSLREKEVILTSKLNCIAFIMGGGQ